MLGVHIGKAGAVVVQVEAFYGILGIFRDAGLELVTANQVYVRVVGLATGVPAVFGMLTQRAAGPEIDVVGILFHAEPVAVATAGQHHVGANCGTILVQGAHAHGSGILRGHVELPALVNVETLHAGLKPQGKDNHIGRQRLGNVLGERGGSSSAFLYGYGQFSAGYNLIGGQRDRGGSFLQAFYLAGPNGRNTGIGRADGYAARVVSKVIAGFDVYTPFEYLIGNGNVHFFSHENHTLVLQETHLVLRRFAACGSRFAAAREKKGCRRQYGGSFRK